MFLLNLTLAEFVGLFGAASAVMVALYLFDRSRRRIQVATLRFWSQAVQPVTAQRRARIQQPLSLILQLIALALLLLALGQLHIGSRAGTPADHVLILDSSAWMSARTQGNATMMDRARERAYAYLRSLPSNDRVMLVRADGLASAVTAFESDRRKVARAIAETVPGATALNLSPALEFARQVHAISARRAGEIMFIGSGRIPQAKDSPLMGPPLQNLRYELIPEPSENVGLRRVNLRRVAAQPDLWEIFVSVRNYGTRPRQNRLDLLFGGAPAGSKTLVLQPGQDAETQFTYRTAAAGLFEVRLAFHDAFPADDRTVLELPRDQRLRVAIYTAEAASLRPILESDPRVDAVFLAPAQYQPKPDAGLMVLDRISPPAAPQIPSIWIDPPRGGPLAVRNRVDNVRVESWNSSHPVGTGLHGTDFRMASASVFVPAAGDVRLAEVAGGPVVVARPKDPKMLVIGFHSSAAEVRYALATPLLFGNAMRWMAPAVFRRWEVAGASAGVVRMPVDSDVTDQSVKVSSEAGGALPFTLKDNSLTYFSGTQGTVRVTAGDREVIHSLTLPEVGEARWEPPVGARRGIPPPAPLLASARNVWAILLIAAAIVLLIEWLMFGRLGHRAALGLVARRTA